MFGRKKKQMLEPTFGDVWQEVEEWAAGLKKPYHAGGFDLEGAAKHITARESKASGSKGHPWPFELKFLMLQRINGAQTIPVVNQTIEKLQLAHEQAVRDEEADARG